MDSLNNSDFADSFGVDKTSFSKELVALIKSYDFTFSRPEAEFEKELILEVLKKINNDNQIIGAAERTEVWYNGWKENLDEFRSSNFNVETLTPKFVRPGNPVRWKQKYIIPNSKEFELQFIKIYLRWIAETYLSNVDTIHEFGSGTGYNLLSLYETLPDKKFVGSDFVDSSVELLQEISGSSAINLTATKFDMIYPEIEYYVGENDGIFTFGSLEQLAGKIDPMINFLLSKKPKVVVHTEPVEEFYDLDILEDYLAFQFQNKRGYSSGLIGRLKQLEKDGVIEIIKMKRLNFGSFFMEGYNHIAWRPR